MIIIIQCRDQVGLVADISGILAAAQLNIISMREHVDKAENRFFMRLEVDGVSDEVLLEAQMRQVLPSGAVIQVNPVPDKKVVVMVTKEYHCLADILIRNNFNTLGAQVLCVIGNHDVLQKICERFAVPFFLIPYHEDKEVSEREIIAKIRSYDPDYVVLAKFMRILSPAFVANFPNKVINIHHSFLPAFAGANPYKKAFERGVKLIGATAHFVTDDLDEGPIIAQQIIPVNHSFTVADMVKSGQEIETAVLAKALRLVLNDRVFVYRNKTVVFE
ncbi:MULTISPECIES: formyltetrahydrofolate deformylase [Pedobacter]|uniref:Formyltetrahydrofolate deformylase n=1 Tax=Pedobacter heparinus (strain ATCC 13125 / DSM 2366 / CIP 104194 / JCM 7457 / NBRC 12017 / NCIMB 9290 / NRRL B-14731 / HIM 762-3) TaxID=485917 RepID=C6XVW5_PEDHD|nr:MULTISPECIES: formyltetrahydrofolate deformylase [Pedobacter]ACU06190.1 formyltetrahydrofolate deformylase [Pedobacter heparinus DSM 2366]MBB5439711.1 formyltetrahydrofolate deformylase [Pedobacter sp. AK017]